MALRRARRQLLSACAVCIDSLGSSRSAPSLWMRVCMPRGRVVWKRRVGGKTTRVAAASEQATTTSCSRKKDKEEKSSLSLYFACMDGGESTVVSVCAVGDGGGAGDGAGIQAAAKEYSAASIPSTSPPAAAFPGAVAGVMAMLVPPPEGAAQALGTMGSGGGGSSGADLFGRKKKGRPRKYGPDGMALALSPTSVSPFCPLSSDGKRGRGRPPGSGKYQLLASLGNMMPPSSSLKLCLTR
ncbi:hypothetical protein B296_00025295 [Ensete ventricosum]|uniref:Uncharacterized protein n=1 Tax=Ensete ventricosum TaxID=4639 RepID=A0A426ZT28_ENSVE|nr:hypothetical protein B296_00025295 [Ensete ventricosum]